MCLYLPAIIINVEQKQIINTCKFVYEIFGLLSLYTLSIKKIILMIKISKCKIYFRM